MLLLDLVKNIGVGRRSGRLCTTHHHHQNNTMPLLLCLLLTILFSIPPINAANNNFNCPTSNRLWTSAHLQPNFCATVIAGGGDDDDSSSSRLYKPRGLHIDKYTDEILLVDRGHPDGSRVVRLDTTTNNDSDDDTTIVPVAILPGLNHGLEANDGYLYASTPGKGLSMAVHSIADDCGGCIQCRIGHYEYRCRGR